MTVEAVGSETQNHEIFEEKEKGDLNGREVEIKEPMEKFKEDLKDFAKDCIVKGATAGSVITKCPSAAVVVVPIIVSDVSKKLMKSCEGYVKAVELENAAKGLDKFGNPLRHEVEHEDADDYEVDRYEKENDRDSWDCEY